jgi:hypothetical protein
MSVSDELLDHPRRLAAIREQIETLVSELGARAGFLVDEDGRPFATVGSMEFRLPHPLTNLGDGEALLRALVGEKPADAGDGGYLVERVGARALLAVLLETPLSTPTRSATRRRVRDSATTIAKLL